MDKYQYTVKLELQAPVLTHSSDTLSFGYDMATRKYQNKPVLNGSLIRGNILHSFNYFADQISAIEMDNKLTKEDINRWFGMESKNRMQAERSMLNFDYFWVLQGTPGNNTDDAYRPRYRIGVSDETGVVEPGNLQVIESMFETGEKPVFSGALSLWAEDEAQAGKFAGWLNKALQYISSVGALKGVGFGKVSGFEIIPIINNVPSNDKTSKKIEKNIKSIEYEFTLDRPLCVSRPHTPDSNKFVSEDFITGAILKGAFAGLLMKLGNEKSENIQKALSEISFSHALPANNAANVRPLPLPLSLALADKQVIDMAQKSEYCLLYKNGKYFAPAFATDWKKADSTRVENRLLEKDINYTGLQSAQRLLSVRTKIDKATNAADDGKLFSLECVDNNQTENETNTATVWRARIGFSKLKNHASDVHQDILQILSGYGLYDIGKTKARADISCTPVRYLYARDESSLKPVIINEANCYIILLRTEARLLSSNLKVKPTNDAQTLHEQYRQYFEYISAKALTLSHFYAQQRLYGGEFYRQHYRGEKAYAPEWLTLAGSVFVLTENPASESGNKNTGDLLKTWLQSGLPVAEDRQEDSWQTDPFKPENGYGEIVINHKIHSVLANPGPDPEQGELRAEGEIR